MFFPEPLPETIFRGSEGQSCPKRAILEQFWVPVGPKMDPWSDILAQKAPKSEVPRVAVSVLEPPRMRPATQTAQG